MKKSGLLLTFFIASLLILNLAIVSASWATDVKDAIVRYTVPDSWGGSQSQEVMMIIGIIAMILIFVIMVDVFQLFLPFSDWVTYVLATGFTIVGLLLGIVREIAGWGLVLAAYITGGAGTFAIVMTAVIFLAGIIFLFFGWPWLQKQLLLIKIRRAGVKKVIAAAEAAEDIGVLRTLAGQVATKIA